MHGAQFGRVTKARFALAGAQAELKASSPLAGGESVLLTGAMRLRGVGPLPRPAIVRLSTDRLAVLAHYAFRPDKVWELPRLAVRSVELFDDTVRLVWRNSTDAAEVLQLSSWTGQRPIARPIRDTTYVADTLSMWLAAGGNGQSLAEN